MGTVIYTGITFICMALYGVEEWIERGDAFNAYFGMFAWLGPFEVRDDEAGAASSDGRSPVERDPGAAALVLTSIGVTSFDGAQEGVLSGAIKWTFERCSDLGFSLPDAFRVANSIWLLITVAAVSGLYWLGVAGMHTVRSSPPVKELGRSFAHTLIPIARHPWHISASSTRSSSVHSHPVGSAHYGSDLFGTVTGSTTIVG